MCVLNTSDGSCVVEVRHGKIVAGLFDISLDQTEALSDTLLTRTYGGIANDFGESVQQTTDGGFIVVGNTGYLGAGSSDI